MIKLPNTLSFRLTLWYATVFLLCLLAALITLYLSLNTILNSRMDDDLHEDIAEFNELFKEDGLEALIQEIQREVNSSDEGEIFLRLFDQQGIPLFSSDLSEWKGLDSTFPPSTTSVISKTGSLLRTFHLDDQEYPTRAVSGLIGEKHTLQVGETLQKNEEIMEILLLVFGGLLLFGIPIASGCGWIIARKAVRGVEAVSQAAKAIEEGDLNRRVSVRMPEDEIRTLADSFNSMATRITQLIHEMRDMTDNIAHDLRSPLARIRALSEAALTGTTPQAEYQQVARDTLKECDRLMHLINTTLDMAEFDAGVSNRTPESIDLSQVVTDLIELFEPLAEAKHLTLHRILNGPSHIIGDKHNVQRMIANLLDNALKYTPEGGQISMELKRVDGSYRLTIADTGIGIPLPDQPKIFDRFYRCDQSRSQEGCGLGLSFARSVARAHGGDITLKSETAKGSVFTSIFPIPTSQSS